jgi:hypothetical protein
LEIEVREGRPLYFSLEIEVEKVGFVLFIGNWRREGRPLYFSLEIEVREGRPLTFHWKLK